MPRLFEGARRNMMFVAGFTAASVLFWFIQFLYQFHLFEPGNLELALVRSFAFAGATMIAAALLSSAVFRWVPRWMRYSYVRRSLGVVGFTFTIFHVVFVLGFVLQYDLLAVVSPLNPLENPLVFGLLAFPIYLAMWATSTDWAVAKMGFRRWKSLHRLVYLAFLFSVLHFITVNPPALMNVAGYLLLAVTFLALAGELFWFVKTRLELGFSGAGSLLGFSLIFVWLLVIYFAVVAPLLS